MNNEEKKAALKRLMAHGFIISFMDEEYVFYTENGHSREKIRWEDIFSTYPEINTPLVEGVIL